MLVSRHISDIRQARRAAAGATWGFVPTMGYLHPGHLALVQRARAENDRVAVSIYVNPTQFDAEDDLAAYPRDMARDLALLETEEVDLVFTPDDAIMYPAGFQTTVQVAEVTRPLEGAARPGHFAGVATVVAKLLNIVQPTRAYFGQKDAQQTVVIRRMVADLNIDTHVVICPTVREADGVALSSRNARLNPAQRQAATVLHRALRASVDAWERGERDAGRLRTLMENIIGEEPLARIDYVSVSDPDTLEELDVVDHAALLSMAVYIDQIRLIDNMRIG